MFIVLVHGHVELGLCFRDFHLRRVTPETLGCAPGHTAPLLPPRESGAREEKGGQGQDPVLRVSRVSRAPEGRGPLAVTAGERLAS